MSEIAGLVLLVLLGFLTALAWRWMGYALAAVGVLLMTLGGAALGTGTSVLHEGLAGNLIIGGLTLIGLGRLVSVLQGVRREASAIAGQLRASTGFAARSGGRAILVNGYPATLAPAGNVTIHTTDGDLHFASRKQAGGALPKAARSLEDSQN